jgi:hypothetical protein
MIPETETLLSSRVSPINASIYHIKSADYLAGKFDVRSLVFAHWN